MALNIKDPEVDRLASELASRWGTTKTDAIRRALNAQMSALQTQRNADQAADNLSVSNAVTSLRDIGDADWPDIVARTSLLMRQMLTSPVFEAEHAATRDQTLHGIERLSRRSGRSEREVAQRLLDLMHAAPPGDALAGVPSHWLLGAGRPALLRALGLHERAASAWRGTVARLTLPVYLMALLLGTLGLTAWLLLRQHSTLAWAALPAALLMLFPASEAVVAVINRLISESARPRHLPRLAFGLGIPAGHRVLVAVPAMLTDVESVDALLHRLELHHLANPEREAQFALLTNWADADTAQRAGDAALLAHAVQGIEALNRRHPGDPRDTGAAPRFIVLHREREYSETEQRWIGWERKRGKLEEFNRLLRGAVGNWELDSLHGLTDSVYTGRFVTEQQANRRSVTFIPAGMWFATKVGMPIPRFT